MEVLSRIPSLHPLTKGPHKRALLEFINVLRNRIGGETCSRISPKPPKNLHSESIRQPVSLSPGPVVFTVRHHWFFLAMALL